MTDGHQPHEPGLDAIAAFNRDRWEALVAADVLYARPLLDLDTAGARATVDPYGLLGDVAGRVFDVYGDDTVVYPGHGDDTTLGAERPHLGEWRERGW